MSNGKDEGWAPCSYLEGDKDEEGITNLGKLLTEKMCEAKKGFSQKVEYGVNYTEFIPLIKIM